MMTGRKHICATIEKMKQWHLFLSNSVFDVFASIVVVVSYRTSQNVPPSSLPLTGSLPSGKRQVAEEDGEKGKRRSGLHSLTAETAAKAKRERGKRRRRRLFSLFW